LWLAIVSRMQQTLLFLADTATGRIHCSAGLAAYRQGLGEIPGEHW
jgi:hypothetical protein